MVPRFQSEHLRYILQMRKKDFVTDFWQSCYRTVLMKPCGSMQKSTEVLRYAHILYFLH